MDRKQIKVRLAEIDAPERKQPFGTRSRMALADLCFLKPAVIDDSLQDRYSHTVSNVNCAGTDASSEQVKRGMAWVFDRYSKPSSPLYALQRQAKDSQVGLWRDAEPIPPWDFRRTPKSMR